MADPGRLERPACGFEVRRSIQLSYGSGNLGVSEGIRTPDRWSHNPELYRLSYAHQEKMAPLFWHFHRAIARRQPREIPGNHNGGLLLSGTGSRAQKTKSV